ncbi:PepSY-associated TM helix domain-containing protein [Oleiharenicola sp. Vm1]|uniref:PepSY-associated TM helix domain-containing protein n=1 Tax=Oleiharenicola sp. Vm1 TaxID=3398393 RepID=UPI0039F4BB5D
MTPAVRKWFLNVHLWAGLGLGALLLIVSLTGALLVFRSNLERRLDPARWIVAPSAVRLAPEQLVARAAAAHPAGEVESIRTFGDPTAPFLVYFSNKDYVHLNPYTGEVLGTRARYGEGFGWIEGLHKYLQLAPSVGEAINGYNALAFLLIIATGVVLWWPATRRALVAGVTLNRKLSGRPWNLNLHKTVGAYAALLLAVMAFTGAPISLDWLKNALYPLTGSTKAAPPAAPAPSAPAAVGFDRLVAAMAARYPAARETYVPVPKKGLVAAYSIEAGAAHPNARSYAYWDAATGALLRAQPYATAPAGLRVYYFMMSLHTGVWGGPAMQVVLLLGALAVPLLTYTGVASWLRRKSGRAAATASARPASSPQPQPAVPRSLFRDAPRAN